MVNTLFILDEHLKTKQVLTVSGRNTFFDDIYTLDLSTGTESYEFSTNVNDIEESNYVMFYYHNQYKLFQITEIEQEHSEGGIITTIYGECACLELLNGAVRPFNGLYNCISFFEYVLSGTGWTIGKYSSSLAEKVVNVNVDNTTQIWSCIQDHIGEFGYELNARVIYENGHVKAKLIDVYAEGELGEKTYKRFEYGRNVAGITKKKDLYEWCTALILDSKEDVVDIEYNKGGYVKSRGSDVILATNENKKYNLGKSYIYGSYEDNDSSSGQEVVEKGVKELKRRATPHFDYECDTALTYKEYEDIGIGDTVYVIDHSFSPSLTLEARVGELEISFTNRNDCKCNLTNYKEIKSKINISLTGNIKDIINTYFPITTDKLANGSVTKDKLNTGTYDTIIADSVIANKVITEDLIAKNVTAINGQFENLSSIYATIENLNATNLVVSGKADINELNAAKSDITDLTALVGDIKTLVNGNLTSDNIQALTLTAGKVTVDDAFIKDAMIDTVSANKIYTGVLNTNNVNIQSEDGSMLLQGSLQQFKDANGNVRIQIGKDTTGDFTFALYGADGKGQLINQDGIKASAISDGLIVDAMVNDNANISGGKLDISSVITSINNNENTLLSSKIKFSDIDQTLDVAFNQLKTKVETIENVTIDGDLSSVIEQVSSNTTNIGIAQGQINTLISNTTITKQDGTIVLLKDEFNSVNDTVNSHTQTINSHTSTLNTVTAKQSTLEQDLSGFKTTVIDTYVSKTDYNNFNSANRNLLLRTEQYKDLTGSNKENEILFLYNISDTSLMAGKTVTVSFKYRLTNYKSGSFRVQTAPNNYQTFKNITPTGDGTFEYVSTMTMSNETGYTYIQMRFDNFDGEFKLLGNTAILAVSGKKADWTPAPEDIKADISTVTQTADKINWVVGSGTSKSDMSLTSEAYNLIANNINLTGKVTFNCLDSSTQDVINTASSKASSANTILLNEANDWRKAFKRTSNWAYSDIDEDTTINGAFIQTGTITADKILVGDYTNFITMANKNEFIGSKGGTTLGLEVCNISGSEKNNDAIISNKIYALSGGEKFKVVGNVKCVNNTGTIQITSCWRNSTGELLVSSTSSFEITSANTWQTINDIITVPNKPTGASYFNFKIKTWDSQQRRFYVEDLCVSKMVSGELIVDGAIDGKTIHGVDVVGAYIRGSANFMTAPDEGATDGYGFRIYSTGEMYTNNDINIEGFEKDYVYLTKDGKVNASNYVQTPYLTTGNSSLTFGIKGAGASDFSRYNLILQDREDGYSYFRPGNNGMIHLGLQSAMWNKVYSISGIDSSSDRIMKENIEYLDTSSNTRAIQSTITEEDLYNFVKNDLITAKYNYKGDSKEYIGFIAQDILCNSDGTDNIIGQLIVNKADEEQSPLTISDKNYIGVLAGALRKAIHKIEELERKINND